METLKTLTLNALKDFERKFYYREVVKNFKFCKPLDSKGVFLKGAELHTIALNLLEASVIICL